MDEVGNKGKAPSGAPQERWFAARTRCGAELSVAGRLDRLGVERFVPTEVRRRTRGAATYERALIPALVFLRATKQQACALANEQSLPVRYLIDPATRSLLVVPDKQMEDFRRVLDLSTDEGGLVDRPANASASPRASSPASREESSSSAAAPTSSSSSSTPGSPRPASRAPGWNPLTDNQSKLYA